MTAATDIATEPRGPRTAHASVYAPCTGRTWWWIAFLCPWCGAGHLGRARTEEQVPGIRRTRCGGLVRVKAARVYRGREAALWARQPMTAPLNWCSANWTASGSTAATGWPGARLTRTPRPACPSPGAQSSRSCSTATPAVRPATSSPRSGSPSPTSAGPATTAGTPNGHPAATPSRSTTTPTSTANCCSRSPHRRQGVPAAAPGPFGQDRLAVEPQRHPPRPLPAPASASRHRRP